MHRFRLARPDQNHHFIAELLRSTVRADQRRSRQWLLGNPIKERHIAPPFADPDAAAVYGSTYQRAMTPGLLKMGRQGSAGGPENGLFK